MEEQAESTLKQYLSELCANKPENFANGREMRNLFETVFTIQANRLALLSQVDAESLMYISKEDLEASISEINSKRHSMYE